MIEQMDMKNTCSNSINSKRSCDGNIYLDNLNNLYKIVVERSCQTLQGYSEILRLDGVDRKHVKRIQTLVSWGNQISGKEP